MKLFIWNDPYQVDYGSSLLLVLANDLKEAKEQILKAKFFEYTKFEEQNKFNEDELLEIINKLGDPIRIIEGPYAEFNEWHE